MLGKKEEPSIFENAVRVIKGVGRVSRDQSGFMMFEQENIQKTPAVVQAVKIISDAIIGLPLEVVDQDKQPVKHRITNINTRSDEWRYIIQQFVMRGNGFGRLTYSGPRAIPNGFEPLNYSSSEWKQGQAVYSLQEINLPNSRPETYSKENILHFRYGVDNGLVAASPIDEARIIIRTLEILQQALGNTAEKSIKARDVLAVDHEIIKGQSPDKVDLLIKQIRDAYSDESGIVILPAGVTLQNRDNALIDQSIINYNEFAVEQIARIFNLPARYVGIIKNLRVATDLQEMSEDFVRFAIQPRLDAIEYELENKFFNNQDKLAGLQVRFDSSSLAKGSVKARVGVALEAFQGGLFTKEEAREYIGIPAEADGEFAPLMPGAIPSNEVNNNNERTN